MAVLKASTKVAERKTAYFVYLLSLVSAIGGLLFGYDTGVISGAMLLLKTQFNLTNAWQEAIVSITVAAAALFSLIGGYATEKFGRRMVIFGGSVCCMVGPVLLACSVNKEMLLVGRFIVGAGVGLASMTVPMYIAEAAPKHLRGRLVTMNNLFITGGQFVASLIAGGFSYVQPNGWNYMLGLAAVPSAIQFIGFLFMPESPRWLIEHGYDAKARQVLLKITTSQEEADEEFNHISVKHLQQPNHKSGSVFVAMIKSPSIRRALIVGCLLQLFQQCSGINTVMYYSATIIQMAGVKSTNSAIWLSALTAFVNFICTFLGLYLVEKIGRRPLTLISLFGVAVSLVLLGVAFQLMASTSPPIVMIEEAAVQNYSYCTNISSCNSCISSDYCGYCFYESLSDTSYNGSCLPTTSDTSGYSTIGRCNQTLPQNSDLTWAYDWCPSSYSWLAILGLILYLFAFAPGMGPMPWTINSEIYPQWARSTGNGLATTTNWTFNLIISMTFLSLLDALTKQGAYYFYGAISFVGFVVFYLLLPETKGKTLEDVETLFANSWFTMCKKM